MSSRTETLLGAYPRDSRIIEIGPSFNPIAPKADGWNSQTIDHLSREGLVEKYAGLPGIDPGRIETVDFVWKGGSLSDAVPEAQHGSFDIFLASHVIEHTPDLVAFLQAAQTLLKPDGAVVLAVPDKRYCFDYFQPLTTTGQVLEAHAERRTRHTGERAFDHYAYAVTDGGVESWGQHPIRGIRLLHSLNKAADHYAFYESSENYHDLHAWHFVPKSFELLILELSRLGKIDLHVERSAAPGAHEFFVWLRRGAAQRTAAMTAEVLEARRVELLKNALLEQQSQIDWLLAAEPDLTREDGGLSTWATPVRYERTHAALMRSEAERARSEAEAAGLRDRLEVALQQVAALEGSTSWRVTAPLRSLVQRLQQVRVRR
ncbi:class I SAM-dependent methyltransferase [Lichenicoccus roseus]|uniref:class I SAM-dependent methyltransferase n=1 Tax=Lichenicoccus roseus TaxID=2683649 RepID=UPI001486C64F|nr:methyltransferase domain-containing protein [Lichenicoccus roseus]